MQMRASLRVQANKEWVSGPLARRSQQYDGIGPPAGSLQGEKL